jgi:hypothetical protein
MDDFLFSIWGIMMITHVVGWIAFQPYLVRAISRNTVINCPEGNSPEFCRENHPLDCRFNDGIQKNVEAGALWGGTSLAFFWELTALFYFFAKRASAPDAIQKEYQAQVDQVSRTELEKFQNRIQEMRESRELEAKSPEPGTKPSDGTVYKPEPLSLREVNMMMRSERRRRESSRWEYQEPDWMRGE